MTPNETILFDEFNSIREDILALYESRGRRASGEFEEQMEVEVEGLTVRLLGAEHTEYTVDGRAEGRFPPIDVIEKWIEDKGIINSIEGDISVSSLAFLIARKIAREGTEVFKEGGDDMISSVITPERIQMIIDRVSQLNVSTFTSRFTEMFQELAV